MTHAAKHTPGPWIVDGVYTIRGPKRCVVAKLIDSKEPYETKVANGHMLAAAPAMYEALKDSLVLLEASYHDMHDKFGAHDLGTLTVFDCVEKVKAALAQAEGRDK